MGRIASTALASGFAAPALLLGALALGTPGAGTLATGTAAVSAAQPAASSTPKPTGSPRATGGATPPPPQHIVHTGPPAPVNGMPRPGANCLNQHGRRSMTGEPWAQRALDVSSVWDLTRGQHVTVAVVDSGIDFTPQLAGRVSRTDLTGGNGEDCVPHGTLVSSIIAASDARAKGVPFYGMAPAARILSVRVQAQEGTDGQSNAARAKVLTDIANGIRYAVNEHAKVINVSIQVSASYPALRLAIQYAQRRNVVVVAAAGNDNPGGGQGPFYPASYPGVLSVNAVDQQGQLGSFDVSRTPVSVTAPGVNVAADYPGGFDPAANGTSFAAAFVSGEAALVRAAYPRLSAAQVVHRIIATAAGHTGAHTGAGMINPVQAVTAVLPSQPAAAPPQPTVSVPRPRAVNPVTRTVALSVTGGAIGVTALVAVAAAVLPAGRRRRWRSGLAGATAAARTETTAAAGTEPTRAPARAARTQTLRPEATRTEVARPEVARPEAPRAEAARSEAARAEAPGAEAARSEAARAEAPGAEAVRAEAPRAEAARAEAPRAEVPRAGVARAAAETAPAGPRPASSKRAWPAQIGTGRRSRLEPPAYPDEPRQSRAMAQPLAAPPTATEPPARRRPRTQPRPPETAEPAGAPAGAARPTEAPAPDPEPGQPAPRQPTSPKPTPRQSGARHRRH